LSNNIGQEGKRLISTALRLDWFCGPTQPSIQWVTGALSSEVKRPGRGAGLSLASNAEVKNDGAKPPLPHTSSWHDA
jgi:hypothetical protein